MNSEIKMPKESIFNTIDPCLSYQSSLFAHAIREETYNLLLHVGNLKIEMCVIGDK